MKFTVDLPDDVAEALERYRCEESLSAEEALQQIIADWLIAHGQLSFSEIAEDTPTGGSA